MTEPCMFPNPHEPFYCRIHADVRLRLTDERCRRGVTLTQPHNPPCPAQDAIRDTIDSQGSGGAAQTAPEFPGLRPPEPASAAPQPDAGLRDDLRGLLHEISGDLDARADSGDDISRDLGDRLRAALRSTPAAPNPDPVADVLLVREQDQPDATRSTPAARKPDARSLADRITGVIAIPPDGEVEP